MGIYTYLILDVVSFLSVFVFSFMKPVYYYKQWRYVFTAITITGLVFIVWDHFFTEMGVWEFNPKYVIGLEIFSLPLEEWLFFIIIPFACVFIYENIKVWKGEYFLKWSKYIFFTLVVLLTLAGLINYEKIYSLWAFIGAAIIILIHYFLFREKFLGIFLIAYLIHLLPFFVVNGILTSEPVVIYNNMENLGIRLGTIPVEDTMYSLSLFLMNVTIFEWIRKK
jgi:lycopene cyclase domain-containing protein